MPFSRTLHNIRRTPMMARLAAAAGKSGQEAYLTGGYLRDRLGGAAAKPEIDITVQDPSVLLEALPRKRGESVFLLDRERDTFRLVLPPGSPLGCVDLTRFRGACIEEDLRLRDFTVNALALDIRPRAPLEILDPTGGLGDLAARRLRPCSPGSFRDDPLRAIRGIRLAVNLRFRLSVEARALMGQVRRLLRAVAGERIRDELFQILQGPAPLAGAALLLESGLLESLSPALGPSTGTSLASLRRVCTVITGLPRGSALGRRLREPLQQGVERKGLLALAALLSDRGGLRDAARVSRRLVLGGRASAALEGLLGRPVPPSLLDASGAAGRPEMLRLFRSHDGFADEAILLAAVLRFPPAEAARRTARLLRRYRACRQVFLGPPLLTGTQALRHLGLSPGPALGDLLRRIREAQDLGAFRDPAGALKWARRLLAGRED